MNKIYTLGLVMFSFCVNNNLMAACGGTLTPNLGVVSGKLVQGSYNGESWNEVHCSNNKLWDLKQGNSDPVDPSEYVGEWRIDGNQLEHKYDTLVYRYDLYELGGVNYCLQAPGGNPSINVTITTVQNPSDVCK